MNYIVLDMEWNQPFDTKRMLKRPVVLQGEIIQIGAVKLDENYHMLDTFKIMVMPKYYTKMHKKVSKITKITNEELQYGFPFPVAFKHFKKWCGEDFVFLTWGTDDIKVLRDNMILHKLDARWIPNAYNIQVIFDGQVTKERRKVSLLYAMEKIGEPAFEAHDALNDARNTVSICLHLDMSKGIAEYAALRRRMNNQSEKVYSTQKEALEDLELVNFFCPTCGYNVECVDFARQGENKIICSCRCENGDELFVRFKFTKLSNGKFRVTRILHEMDEEKRAYYSKMKQQSENLWDESPYLKAEGQ